MSEPQHWPTERMIMEGHAEYATEADLESADDATLVGVRNLCDVKVMAPDECIPCLAEVMLLSRDTPAPVEDTEPCGAENSDYPEEYSCTYPKGHGPIPSPETGDESTYDHAAPQSGAWWTTEDDEGQVIAPLLDLAQRVSARKDAEEASEPEEDERPVSEIFADKVAELSVLVEELLHGPPIPPRGVANHELALLVVAADKWVKIQDAQEVQTQFLDATRELVARLRS